MVMAETGLGYDAANALLVKHGSVRNAVEAAEKS